MRNVKHVFTFMMLLLASMQVFAQQQNFSQLNLRGTHNGWSNTAMVLDSDNTWVVNVSFGSGASERFKFDVWGDWSQNYGDNNADGFVEQNGNDIQITEGAGDYIITFNDANLSYTIEKQGSQINQPPTADAGADITINVGETAFFDASGSSDPDGSIVSYDWDNGLTGVTPSLVYGEEGTFVVELTVMDDDGATASDSVTVTVLEESTQNFDDLFLRGTFNSWAATPMMAMGNNVWSMDATFGDGSNERFKFDVFGDWSQNYGDDNADGFADRTGDDILITQGAGTYRITFNDETLAYSVVKLGQENSVPVANAGDDISAEVGDTVQFDASASFDTDGSIETYEWSNGLSGVAPTIIYDEAGIYSVTLTVTDNEGASSTDDVVVTISEAVNTPPVADAGPDMTVSVGDTIQFDGSGSFDPDGELVAFSWSNGMTGIMPTAVINDVGTFVVTLTVTDNEGATDSDEVVVNVVDTPEYESNFDSLNLRGTFNSWQTTPMVLVADYTWQVDVVFEGAIADRFKFDVFGDWSQNYGDNNGDRFADRTGDDIYLNRSAGEYRVTFNDATFAYSVEEIVNLAPVAIISGGGVTLDLGESATLDASQSFDPEGSPITYTWSIDASSASSITVTSNEAASIVVTLTVEDAEGAQGSASTTLLFADLSQIPSECFSNIDFLGDVDQDGIPDCAELPTMTWREEQYYALGARINRRDLFVEVDWMDSSDLGIVPQQEALIKVRESFAAQNIGIHFDTGSLYDPNPGINPEAFDLGGGNATPFEQTTVLGYTSLDNHAGLYEYKETYMSTIRQSGPWYYMLIGSSQRTDGLSGSSGRAEINGRHSIVTLGSWNLNRDTERNTNRLINYQAGTIMHEFGHNLNLRHGGFENRNRKPNYLSVMSYDYQLSGLPTIGNQEGDRYLARTSGCSITITNSQYDDWQNFVLDYSHGISIVLDENGIFDETVGFGHPGSTGIDWNCDGDTNDAVIGKDINRDSVLHALEDHDDWGNIQFYFFNNPVSGAGALAEPLVELEVELSVEEPPSPEFLQ